MTDQPTLLELLSAQRAQALLDQHAQATDGDGAERAQLGAALALLGQREYSPDKLDLLRASIAPESIQQTALLMTPMQARRALAPPARRARAKAGAKPEAGEARDGLTVAGLDALPDGAWLECARWLAEQAGYTVEERPLLQHDRLLAWKARGANGASAVVCATRLTAGAPLLESDLRHLHTVAEHEQDARLLAITTAEATVGARLLARDLSARLLDREEVERLLASLATAYARERARTQEGAKAQAKAAIAARKKLIAALTAATQVKAAPGTRRATGLPVIRRAVEQAREARRLAAQALLAWETVITDWLATFGERPARDGSLVFVAQPSVWVELGARADHLKKPLIDALRALAKTPGDGDLGYGLWRQALADELAARCASLLWRASIIDPARWSDYTAAVNNQCAREASLADNAASHAAARAQRAQTDLSERAGAI